MDPLSWLAVIEFYRGLCAYCEERPYEQQDHIRPITKKGEHRIGNVVPACGLCNMRKGTSTKWAPRRRHPWMEAA